MEVEYSRSERLWTLFVVVAGWAFDSFDFSVLSFALNQMMAEFGVSKTVIGSVFGLQLVATAIGGVLFGIIADSIGRKRGLMLDIALYSIAIGLTALSRNLWEVALFRFAAGLGIGGEWGLGMATLNEVWPSETRGSMVGLTQAGWPLGMAMAAADAALVMSKFGWRAGFAVAILPIVLLVIVRGKTPESKLWLRYKEAKERGELPPELSEKVRWLTLRQLSDRDLLGRTPERSAPSVAGDVLLLHGLVVGSRLPRDGQGHVDGTLRILRGRLLADRVVWTRPLRRDSGQNRQEAYLHNLRRHIRCVRPRAHGRGPGLSGFLALAANTFACGFFSVYGALFGELFPTRVRATGASLCYNGARGVPFAAPIVLGWIAGFAGFNAGLIVAVVAISAAAALIWTVPETKGSSWRRSARSSVSVNGLGSRGSYPLPPQRGLR